MSTETETTHEVRAKAGPVKITKRSDGEGQCCEGYGIVFYNSKDPGTEYKLFDDLIERISPSACNRTLASGYPCRSFVNHSPNNMLGRTDKGTLRLKVDEIGCHYSCDLPDTQIGRDTAENLKNGNLDGSSFSFDVRGQIWEDRKLDDGSILTIRTITDIDLYEIGPVSMPAYEATTAGLRSGESPDQVRAQRDLWRKQRALAEAEAIRVRSRTMEVRA